MKKENKKILVNVGLKADIKYAVGFMLNSKTLWIELIDEFCDARTIAEKLGGTVFLQHPEHGITDAIWPKEMPIFTWTDMDECLLHAAGIKKFPPEPMFNYVVRCGDYGMDGYEWSTEYAGTDREKALEGYKQAKAWMGMAEVSIEVLGRKERKEEEEEEWDNDWFDQSFLSDFD